MTKRGLIYGQPGFTSFPSHGSLVDLGSNVRPTTFFGCISIIRSSFPSRPSHGTIWAHQSWARLLRLSRAYSNAYDGRIINPGTQPIYSPPGQIQRPADGWYIPSNSKCSQRVRAQVKKWNFGSQKSTGKDENVANIRNTSSMALLVIPNTNGATPSTDGGKPPELPITGAVFSTLRRSHTRSTRLSRIRTRPMTLTQLMNKRLRMILMESIRSLKIKPHRCLSRSASWPTYFTM